MLGVRPLQSAAAGWTANQLPQLPALYVPPPPPPLSFVPTVPQAVPLHPQSYVEQAVAAAQATVAAAVAPQPEEDAAAKKERIFAEARLRKAVATRNAVPPVSVNLVPARPATAVQLTPRNKVRQGQAAAAARRAAAVRNAGPQSWPAPPHAASSSARAASRPDPGRLPPERLVLRDDQRRGEEPRAPPRPKTPPLPTRPAPQQRQTLPPALQPQPEPQPVQQPVQPKTEEAQPASPPHAPTEEVLSSSSSSVSATTSPAAAPPPPQPDYARAAKTEPAPAPKASSSGPSTPRLPPTFTGGDNDMANDAVNDDETQQRLGIAGAVVVGLGVGILNVVG